MSVWLDDLVGLLERPVLDAWRGLRQARLEADLAWFEARDRGTDPGPAMDRQVACLIVQEALRHRVDAAELAQLPWRDLVELSGLFPPGEHDAALSALAGRLDDAPDGELGQIFEVLRRAPRGRRALSSRQVEALVERGQHELALSVLGELEQPFEHLRAARALYPRLDDDSRRTVAHQDWCRARDSTYLDQFFDYGAACVAALWLGAVRLWSPGDPDALVRLRWLEQHVELFPRNVVKGSQDYDDLRFLTACAWAHHGDAERALSWYARLGEDAGYHCGELAALLPDDDARSLVEAYVDAQLTRATHDLERRDATWVQAPRVLEVLDAAPAGLGEALLPKVDDVLRAHPAARDLWQIALVPWLPEAQAHPLWRAQFADVTARADMDASLDERLEALVDTLVPGGAVLDEVLALVARWPRAEPFGDLDVAWPTDDLARPLATVLARPDATPNNDWGKLVADLVDRAPHLRAQLSPPWAEALAPRPRTVPRCWIQPGTIDAWLEGQPDDVQRTVLASYGRTLAGWSEQDAHDALARLLDPTRTTAPSSSFQPRQAMRDRLDQLLAGGNADDLTVAFQMFASAERTGSQHRVWLTQRLMHELALLRRWLDWLTQRDEPMRTLQVIGDALRPPCPTREAREACVDTLERAARTALMRRAEPDTRNFYTWGAAIRWASVATLHRLWERRFMLEVSDGLRFAELQLALRLGGPERLVSAFEAIARVRSS